MKACAGLNGMKLGTSFLTVVQATPDADTKVPSLYCLKRCYSVKVLGILLSILIPNDVAFIVVTELVFCSADC